jgi:hypothetical protein
MPSERRWRGVRLFLGCGRFSFGLGLGIGEFSRWLAVFDLRVETAADE